MNRLPRRLVALGAFALLPLNTLPTAAAPMPASPQVELIPRDVFFGNPTRAQLRVSPDGQWLSWLAPRDGVLNIWIAPVAKPDEARALTAEKGRPIRQHFWAPNAKLVLFINDKGGDENFLLYGADVAGGDVRTLTPFEKTRVQIVAFSEANKDEILVGINNRDPQWHDVHRLNLRTGALTLVRENNEWAGFEADDSLTLRLATKQTDAGGMVVHRIGTDGKVEAQPFLEIPYEDSLTTGIIGFTADGRTLYAQDSRGRDKSALVKLDLQTAAPTMVAESTRADIDDTLRHPTTRHLQAYSVNYLKNEWHAIDPAIAPDLAFLREKLGPDFQVTARTDDDRLWTVAFDPVTASPAFHVYDRAARTLKKLFVVRPELEGKPLVAMHPREIRSRDGLTLTAYLSLPPGVDADADGRPEKPLPLVLNVHGGPWARDGYGFNPEHQWMANRGYAVLSVNYRGSTGFGKGFIAAADLQWAGRMHDDLIDAVNWAVREGIAQKEKTAIYGGSYGGYATLVGLTFTPDVFACGVDIVGPSNLNTLLASIPPYWEPLKQTFYRRMGDPRTEEGRKLLAERSPLSRVEAIRKPLLIAQGANDPRVKQAEADQIVQAMKARGIPVTYVLYPDEGHGFARPENRRSFYAIAEAFLAGQLGGRFEPVGSDFKGSSLVVPDGAAAVPGLEQALATK